MKLTLLLLVIGIITLVIPLNISRPSFNGTTPGCDGGGCHTLEEGKVSVLVTDFQIQVTVTGTSGDVAGELVDAGGTVVDFIDVTSSNPFTLTAPSPGDYTVNAGHSGPLRWDSSSVTISATDVGENPSNPSVFKLYDNYPNPFNPSTTIRFSLPQRSDIELVIYDELGNEIRTLVSGDHEAGTYEVDFDATGLSSGIYFYQIKSASFTETRKLVLMK